MSQEHNDDTSPDTRRTKAHVHHFALTCDDVLAMEDFYRSALGFERVFSFDSLVGPIAVLRRDRATLELFEASVEAASGYRHVALGTDHVAQVAQELATKGVPVSPVGKHLQGVRNCFLTDPEGNVVELIEGDFPVGP